MLHGLKTEMKIENELHIGTGEEVVGAGGGGMLSYLTTHMDVYTPAYIQVLLFQYGGSGAREGWMYAALCMHE